MKGAPEWIWEKCKYLLINNKSVEIDKMYIERFELANWNFALEGERVLGFSRILLSKSEYPANFKFNLKNPFELPFKDF